MEYAQGVTLDTFMKQNRHTTIDQRRRIIKGLLNGLRELAKLKIVHRDIKPDNIIISQNTQSIKIADFGLATYIDEPNYIYIRCGTPGFVAPEILKIKDVDNARLGVQSDMFSLGAIYYHLIYGVPLFQGKNTAEVLAANRLCQIAMPEKINLSYGQLQLLHGMLTLDPNFRLTPEQALKSPFLVNKKTIASRAFQPIDKMQT